MKKKVYPLVAWESYLNLADLAIPVDWDSIFGRQAPVEVEIGFGTGEYIVGLAKQAPDKNFVGLEQCAERILKTMRKISQEDLGNVKLLKIDAAWAFRYLFPSGSVYKMHCLFPCPWPKKRHIKHRLLTKDFLRLVNSRLLPGGQLCVVTDHHPYADWIGENLEETGLSVMRRRIPPQFGTKFEKKWLAAGQQMFEELVLTKQVEIDLPENEVVPMQTYFLDKIDPGNVEFARLSGDMAIEFKDFVFDVQRAKGMVQAVVTERRHTQYLWITIQRTAKGWCLSVAAGNSVLPTEGIRKALELAKDSFLASGIKS